MRRIKRGGSYEDVFAGQKLISPPELIAGNKLSQLAGGAITLTPMHVPYQGGEQLSAIHQQLAVTAQQAGENAKFDVQKAGKKRASRKRKTKSNKKRTQSRKKRRMTKRRK